MRTWFKLGLGLSLLTFAIHQLWRNSDEQVAKSNLLEKGAITTKEPLSPEHNFSSRSDEMNFSNVSIPPRQDRIGFLTDTKLVAEKATEFMEDTNDNSIRGFMLEGGSVRDYNLAKDGHRFDTEIFSQVLPQGVSNEGVIDSEVADGNKATSLVETFDILSFSGAAEYPVDNEGIPYGE